MEEIRHVTAIIEAMIIFESMMKTVNITTGEKGDDKERER